MCVPEKEGVIGEQGRNDPVFGKGLELILADELAVDADRPAILGGFGASGRKMRLQQQVNGGITVAVHLDLDIVVIAFFGHRDDRFGWHARRAAVVLFAGGAAGQIRLGEPGSLALRRAIDRRLAAADLEVIVIGAPG